ncbi:hypothetical protein EDC04DRAFT_2614134 [Pisolithus marmoratus]|nr:hypothetical protein EDC04DRAFT_2614134 [Pisolithus marmoratus]
MSRVQPLFQPLILYHGQMVHRWLSSYPFLHSQGPAEKIPNVEVLQEMINGLQKENIALKAERSAMQNTYNTLVSRLTVHQSDPIASEGTVDVTLRSAPIATMSLLNMPPVLQLNRVDYPRTMRSIWHELHSHGQINTQTTWSLMLLQVKKVFHGELVQMCLELNFCEDSWKSDLLAKKHYSSIKQTWFTNKSDEKLNSTTKQKAKSEVIEDTDSPTGLSNTKHTRINAFTSSYDTSGDGNVSTDWPSLKSNELSLSSGSKVSLLYVYYLSASNELRARVSSFEFEKVVCGLLQCSDSPRQLQMFSDSFSHQAIEAPLEVPPLQTSALSPPVSILLFLQRTSIMAPPLIKNPLSSLCATAPPTSEEVQAPPMSIQALSTKNLKSKPPVQVTLTAPGPADVSGKKKTWRPLSNKSGRTLCMHHYQKQVGGSLDEFNSYFEALSPGAKVKYKDEAKDLVACGIWINGMANIIAKFSSLPMY